MPEKRERGLNQEVVPIREESAPKTAIIDLQKEKDIPVPREVKNWMEKLEEDPDVGKQSNNTDDPGLQTAAPETPKIVLPTERSTFATGFTKPMDEAWRWLSEFVLRIIKKNQGKVKFREE